jgi:ubiquitin-protein ligase
MDLLMKLKGLSFVFLKCLNQETDDGQQGEFDDAEQPKPKTAESSADAAASSSIESLARNILNTVSSASQKLQASQELDDRGSSANALAHLTSAQLYHVSLKDHRFGYFDMKGSDRKYVHHYSGSISSSSSRPPQDKIVRLAQELADISNALPVEETNAIFLRVDESRVDVMKVLVVGSCGTPYAGGCFEFDVFCEDTYPGKPPKVNLTTTGSGAVRFNPNLYNCGKVCLSLLGTWRGSATENWDPKLSTLLQVFCSIQAIIMTDDIYFNEPGYENTAGTPEGDKANTGYANVVRFANVKFAMLEQLRHPAKGFEYVIRKHFYLMRTKIIAQCEEWVEASLTPAAYTGLVSDHNAEWCTKFRASPNAYRDMLVAVVNELREVGRILISS